MRKREEREKRQGGGGGGGGGEGGKKAKRTALEQYVVTSQCKIDVRSSALSIVRYHYATLRVCILSQKDHNDISLSGL